MNRQVRAALPPRYYRDNFQRLCDTVEAQYADLLDDDELALLSGWRALPRAAQCLYVRLVSRRGPWLRESALTYGEIVEIGPVGPALDALLRAGLAQEAAGLDGAELGALFTRAELAAAFAPELGAGRPRGRPPRGRPPRGGPPRDKTALLEAIVALPLDAAARLDAARRADASRIVAPRWREALARLQVLFFGNRHQGLTEFVLADLGVTRYYPYPLDRTQRLFQSRAELDEYLACTALADCHAALLDAAREVELPDLAARVMALQPTGVAGRRRWQRLCNGLARDLERLGRDDSALALYAHSERHPARERRARILERRGDWRAARELCTTILAEPWCEAERDAAWRILPRVARRPGESPAARQRDHFAQIELSMPRGPSVERRAAALLATDRRAVHPTTHDVVRDVVHDVVHYVVHYVENRLFNTLFGLAFWEQIFAPVPGVFHHPFQRGPGDLYDRAFHARRRAPIDARLAELAELDLAAELGAAYRRYHPCACHWVDWRRVTASLVETTAHIVPRRHLLAIFQRLLFDPRDNRRGLPDLIALGERPGQYCLIEVKGPGDTLHDGQRRWLRFFASQGIPARVARVRWCDA